MDGLDAWNRSRMAQLFEEATPVKTRFIPSERHHPSIVRLRRLHSGEARLNKPAAP